MQRSLIEAEDRLANDVGEQEYNALQSFHLGVVHDRHAHAPSDFAVSKLHRVADHLEINDGLGSAVGRGQESHRGFADVRAQTVHLNPGETALGIFADAVGRRGERQDAVVADDLDQGAGLQPLRAVGETAQLQVNGLVGLDVRVVDDVDMHRLQHLSLREGEQLVDALEVQPRHGRRVASGEQRVDANLHRAGQATAPHHAHRGVGAGLADRVERLRKLKRALPLDDATVQLREILALEPVEEREAAADQHLVVGQHRDIEHRPVGAGAEVDAGIDRAVRVQSDDATAIEIVEGAEASADQDFAVRLNGHGVHRSVGTRAHIE